MACQRSKLLLKAFLLGVMMLMPFFRKFGYALATSWLLVLSMRIRLPEKISKNFRIWLTEMSGEFEVSSSSSHLERENEFVSEM